MTVEKTIERDRRDHSRYVKLYEIDINTYDFVDLVIDTNHKTPDQIAEIVIGKAREKAG